MRLARSGGFASLLAMILLANNIPDISSDGQAGIQTIATRLGRPIAARLYEWLAAGVYGVTRLAVILGQLSGWAFLTLLSLPLALNLIKMLRQDIPVDADARTAQLNAAYGILFILSIVLQKFL